MPSGLCHTVVGVWTLGVHVLASLCSGVTVLSTPGGAQGILPGMWRPLVRHVVFLVSHRCAGHLKGLVLAREVMHGLRPKGGSVGLVAVELPSLGPSAVLGQGR